VDNQTEQFLEVRLPGGAALWTARVASQPVKPVQPDAERPESVQVPLVKTAAGDLDYTVVLRYGGALPALGYLGAADFPLAQARNLNVELSQVELRLPRTHHWLNFASTARRVTQAYEFEAGFLAYQSRLARRLAQTLQYGSEFEKARAYSNLKQVGLALRSSQTRFAQARGAPQAASEMQEADLAIREVDQQLEVAQPSPQAVEGVDNRGGLNLAFTGQRNVVAGRAIEAGGANWDEQQVSRTETDRSQAVTFESSWLAGRRLSKVASKPRSEAAPERAGKLSEARPLSRGKGEAKAKDQPAAGAQPKTPTQAPRPEPADELRRRLGEESDTGAQQRRAGRKELAAKYQQRLQAQAGEGEVGTVTEKIAAEGVDRRQALELKDKADEAAPSAAAGVGPSGLASLDVELPAWDAQRWVRVHFTTPRAGVTIGATALSRQVTALLRRLGAAGLVLLLIYAAWRRVSAAHSLAMAGERLASGLAFAGLAAAGLGVLPWAGLVLLAVGLVWYLCLRRRAGAAG
jgi:hypothetical protein